MHAYCIQILSLEYAAGNWQQVMRYKLNGLYITQWSIWRLVITARSTRKNWLTDVRWQRRRTNTLHMIWCFVRVRLMKWWNSGNLLSLICVVAQLFGRSWFHVDIFYLQSIVLIPLLLLLLLLPVKLFFFFVISQIAWLWYAMQKTVYCLAYTICTWNITFVLEQRKSSWYNNCAIYARFLWKLKFTLQI